MAGAAGVQHAIAAHPADIYTLARAAAAVLGTLALWLLYGTGARLFGRGVGLLAAAIEAVAFLPVFYAHLALNDVPTLAPLTLSLLGTAGVLRKGRARDHLLAGIGLGLACATKYTAGIVLVPYLAAVAARYLDVSTQLGSASAGRRALGGIVLAGAVALIAFLIANPYAILDYSDFHAELVHQSTLSAEAQGKLGAPKDGGLAYYLWTLTWGLGWAPALAALGGAVSVWWRERALGWMLVPAPLIYLVFMGTQGRYFGRWLLPMFPILCLLAALFALQLAGTLVRLATHAPSGAFHAGRMAPGVPVGAHRCGLGSPRCSLWHCLRRGSCTAYIRVSCSPVRTPATSPASGCSRTYRRAPGSSPSRPSPRNGRAQGPGAGRRITPTAGSCIRRCSGGSPRAARSRRASSNRKSAWRTTRRTLSPALIDFYEREGYCWVISGSTESGRAYADPQVVPRAIAYYRELARRGEVVYRSSPYTSGQGPVKFGFDWSFDYYPLAYERPGPYMTIYRLHGGRCAH